MDVSDLRSKQNILFCANLSKLKGIFYFTVKFKPPIYKFKVTFVGKGYRLDIFFNHMATISRYQKLYLKLSLS